MEIFRAKVLAETKQCKNQSESWMDMRSDIKIKEVIFVFASNSVIPLLRSFCCAAIPYWSPDRVIHDNS